jgi:hypothetical protein
MWTQEFGTTMLAGTSVGLYSTYEHALISADSLSVVHRGQKKNVEIKKIKQFVSFKTSTM